MLVNCCVWSGVTMNKQMGHGHCLSPESRHCLSPESSVKLYLSIIVYLLMLLSVFSWIMNHLFVFSATYSMWERNSSYYICSTAPCKYLYTSSLNYFKIVQVFIIAAEYQMLLWLLHKLAGMNDINTLQINTLQMLIVIYNIFLDIYCTCISKSFIYFTTT